jgi:hypothetical protein
MGKKEKPLYSNLCTEIALYYGRERFTSGEGKKKGGFFFFI